MEYVPEDVKDKWTAAFSKGKCLKNKQVRDAIYALHNGVSIVKEAGKLSVYKEMKKLLIISVPVEKNQHHKNGNIQTFTVGKPNGEISKEERWNAIVFLSSTGKLMKLNQIILQKIFNVSQSTIAKDISSLKDEGKICPDFTSVSAE
ncbi:hypothetical protein RN38_17085 [Hafnia paralvei]|jgi:hypothetical protein|uniref:Uncharacterized protein n=1 Tax=Hafnia paralvei TaxID=546367 RepID=A0A2A2MD24_9GAMM|nr:hypothetical protein [Hafnia paralvei]KHS43495.1 hypothetical protein RN38_17085 [Hafnia paralvei]PAV96700.1 hypothetical protein CJD50_09610 [Hafnia paralvei]